MMSRLRLSLVLCLGACALTAAENPFAGTWKLNPAKSKFTGMTFTYEQMPGGEWKTTYADRSYIFKMDGKEYEWFFGRKVAWKQLGEKSFEATLKSGAMILASESLQISPDEKSMTMTSSGTQPDGKPFKEVAVYARRAGQKGLAGKWESQKLDVSSPTVLQLKPYGASGVTMEIAAYKASISFAFDGKESTATGPTVPSGLTFSARKIDDRSFEYTEKHQSKPVYVITIRVSPDGKTLTESGKAVGAEQPFTAVYERQK